MSHHVAAVQRFGTRPKGKGPVTGDRVDGHRAIGRVVGDRPDQVLTFRLVNILPAVQRARNGGCAVLGHAAGIKLCTRAAADGRRVICAGDGNRHNLRDKVHAIRDGDRKALCPAVAFLQGVGAILV